MLIRRKWKNYLRTKCYDGIFLFGIIPIWIDIKDNEFI